MLMEVKFGHRVAGIEAPVEAASGVIDDLLVDEDGNPILDSAGGEQYVAGYVIGTSADEVKTHLLQSDGLVTHLPGNGAILSILAGLRSQRVFAATWVDVEPQGRDVTNAEDLERFFADYFGCMRGRPADVEDTHHTVHGLARYEPGQAPEE